MRGDYRDRDIVNMDSSRDKDFRREESRRRDRSKERSSSRRERSKSKERERPPTRYVDHWLQRYQTQNLIVCSLKTLVFIDENKNIDAKIEIFQCKMLKESNERF